jgi:cytidine deaminase
MIPPCGMCRQALSEFGDMKVLLVGLDGEQRSETTLSALLPGPFSL